MTWNTYCTKLLYLWTIRHRWIYFKFNNKTLRIIQWLIDDLKFDNSKIFPITSTRIYFDGPIWAGQFFFLADHKTKLIEGCIRGLLITPINNRKYARDESYIES